MAKINLLPWRAERREHRKREFFVHLGIAAAVAIVLVLLWSFWMGIRIGNQDGRNSYLKAQITQLDSKITQIKNLQKVKDHLLARKRIVEKLQSSRSQMVHLLDQIVKTIPSGIRLTSLSQRGETLTLNGVAQSNATVADYMRNIEASPWMGPVSLRGTSNTSGDANAPYEFQLVVKLGTPTDDTAGTPAAASSSGASEASTAAVAGVPATSASSSTAPATLPTAPVPLAPSSVPVSSAPTPSANLSAPAPLPVSAVAPHNVTPVSSNAPAKTSSKGGARS
ncbi:MAG TPA: PilN domain-containing protein [Rhodanobacteraceae bacterium]